MAPFRVGIDSYCLNPLRMDPFAVLAWVHAAAGEGVQFSEVHPSPERPLDAGMLRELAAAARERGMYLEWGGGQHVPFDTTTWTPKDLAGLNRKAAEEASVLGARVVRSCSGGFFRWHDDAPPTEELLDDMARALEPQRAVFEDLGVTLALELHFEFTTFELARLFAKVGAEPGGWLGVCLDTFNVLPLLEDPVLATERVLPWVVATHVKDGVASLDADGLLTFPTAVGEGSIDLQGILERLATLPHLVHLSVEDHGGSFRTPFFDTGFRARFPDLGAEDLTRLVASAQRDAARVARGEVRITDRADWPGLCQKRTQRDLTSLRGLVAALDGQAS
ncbi:MAG: sugar phosphate isomerase/epimerase [Gemmatimonadetes bacterium]|nr:sugar phosphate isomerase/epimerase [Gemmatimonadota bacterium]